MALRRPEPEGFEEDLNLLMELERERGDLQEKIDEVILRLTIEKKSPTATIAERLKITAGGVSARRELALKRRARREHLRDAA
jgi:hypothetical protein